VNKMVTVIDAEMSILGRLCTKIASKLLSGEEVVVVNAEKAIITGSKEDIFAEYRQKKMRGKVMHGPFYPRRADLIMKRTVRGMLPWDMPRGRNAYKLLKVYVGIPREFDAVEKIKFEGATNISRDRYVTLSEISQYLGSKVR